jgi:predicted transcriptional regulator
MEKIKVVIKGKLVEGYIPPSIKKTSDAKKERKRGHIKMVYDVLLALQCYDKPTWIMSPQVADLSYAKWKEILEILLREGLARIEKIGAREFSVKLTKKGEKTLKLGKEFLSLIGEL